MFEKIKITPNLILDKFFGYSDFREGQLEIINSILSKRDTLAILPTGGGKSICFQIPAIIFSQSIKSPKTTIVISPLISLMKDQVDTLNQKGISACYINSSLSKRDLRETYKLIETGQIKIIYVSPERLKSKPFINLIQKIMVGMIVVDEAHCISQWGDDFRPEYKQISDFYKYIDGSFVKVAFTATASASIQKDICKTLDLKNPFLFFKSFSRKNLFIDVIDCESETIKNLVLLRILNQHKNQTGIIYCSTRKMTEGLSKLLRRYEFSATHYHGAVENKQKDKIQNDFSSGKIKLIVATNAFGMGIDKSNIRFVIHYQVPGNIENYYQEIGRAGRDGKPSNCYCLYQKDDFKIQTGFIKKNQNQKKVNLKKLRNVQELFNSKNCRTKTILKYFGEITKADCNNCDNCIKKKGFNQHPLLLKAAPSEIEIMKKLLQKKYSYSKPTDFLTDVEICYLSIIKPKTETDFSNIPGIGTGWINRWWKMVAPIVD